MEQWQALDEAYSVGEFRLKLLGWQTERRFVVIREVVREGRDSVGRKLIDVPGYVFPIFVTTHMEVPEEIWRDYNLCSDMENRMAELKHDLGADGFCLKQFFATEAAFRAILLLFTCSPNSSAPPSCRVIANRPPFALRVLPAEPFSAAPGGGWFFIYRKAGAACKPETLCSTTSSLGNFQLRPS